MFEYGVGDLTIDHFSLGVTSKVFLDGMHNLKVISSEYRL